KIFRKPGKPINTELSAPLLPPIPFICLSTITSSGTLSLSLILLRESIKPLCKPDQSILLSFSSLTHELSFLAAYSKKYSGSATDPINTQLHHYHLLYKLTHQRYGGGLSTQAIFSQ